MYNTINIDGSIEDIEDIETYMVEELGYMWNEVEQCWYRNPSVGED